MENSHRYTITLDDDFSVHKIIAHLTGVNSLHFSSSEALLRRAKSYDPIAAFIDINLSEDDCGLNVIPELRKIWPYSPILVITSDPNAEYVRQSLAIGASDFVRKPIDGAELMGRLSARINEMTYRRQSDVINVSNVEFSKAQLSLRNGEKVVYLPKLEARILLLLLENRDILVPRQTIKAALWGQVAVSENTLDKKISNLRAALADAGAELVIDSHYGKGLLLRIDPKKANE